MLITELVFNVNNKEEIITELEGIYIILAFRKTSRVISLIVGDLFMTVDNRKIFKVLFKLESDFEGMKTIGLKIGDKCIGTESVLSSLEKLRFIPGSEITIIGSKEVGSFEIGTFLGS